MTLGLQIVWLLVLAVPVACLAWTVTHEELFREPREYCARRGERDRNPLVRKFFYVFTCEYCFSHYVALGFLIITRFHLLYDDWRGYLIAWLALVWLANIYMGIFGKVKLDVTKERAEIKKIEKETKKAA
jgi:hypothetical protein